MVGRFRISILRKESDAEKLPRPLFILWIELWAEAAVST
jgi:hypothetical protein